MNHSTRHFTPTSRFQHGAILITSLILLLVLTLISISGMNLSFLENLMAANTQYQVSALADAEVALRVGEQDLETVVADAASLDFNSTGDQYYLSGIIDPTEHTWSFSHATSGGSKYAIEYLGKRSIPGESTEISSGIAGSFVHVFLVDAQNQSHKGASRNVQTIYVTATAP